MEREAAEQALNQRFVKFDQKVDILKRKSLAQIRREFMNKFETQKKVLMIMNRAKMDQKIIGVQDLAKPAQIANEPIADKFMTFLNSQSVPIPKDKSTHMALLEAMKDSVYHLLEKRGGLSKLSIAFMNEHRRKKKNLPPLTPVDYNCMDRASLKLRMVLDTLSIHRRISGLALKPRNLAIVYKQREYKKKIRHQYFEIVTRQNILSAKLLMLWGPHVEINPVIDDKQILI